MIKKPSIPKGTRDFSSAEMSKRNYIFETIKDVFRLYGFDQIETPAMENLSTLMGKYGEEGDKLLFKILNSGDFLSKADAQDLSDKNSQKMIPQLSEKGLRYDLTVPFARFVVQHRNEITFPFKRYQIQPVWRADRPQKGRYREFYQCDVDVVGSNSLYNELELIQIVDEVYRRLNIDVVIKINNRKILSGIAEVIGESERIIDITVAIDKMEKIGLENVNAELLEKGVSLEAVEKLQPILQLSGSNDEKLKELHTILLSSAIGVEGVVELRTLFELCEQVQLETDIALDLTLARGLNYYTGAIFEVKSKDVQIGSITGGGRYDNLTGVFGVDGLSGVGISFGADRIYDVLNQLNLYPTSSMERTKLLFVAFGEKELSFCLPWAKALRGNGINTELYADMGKMKKQLGYADSKHIPYVAIVGENELKLQKIMLKDMKSGQQNLLSLSELLQYLANDDNA